MTKVLFIILFTILLSGCSTTPKYNSRCLILEHEKQLSKSIITCPPKVFNWGNEKGKDWK